ncbi:unnamed protein product, partial [Effrenium voratum]
DLSMLTDQDILGHQDFPGEHQWFEPGEPTLYQCYFTIDDDGFQSVAHIIMEPHHQDFYETYVTHLAHNGHYISTVHGESDQDLDDMRQGPARPASLSRQEAETRKKELP